jgi:hypothetical protein
VVLVIAAEPVQMRLNSELISGPTFVSIGLVITPTPIKFGYRYFYSELF